MAYLWQLIVEFVLKGFQQSRDCTLLAAMFTVSRECHRRCLELLRRHTRRPTEMVSGLSCEAQLRSVSCRQWSIVLNIAGRTAASSDAELAALVLLTTPNLPQLDAKKAIRAGLRVSYDQFVLAARLRIPGIEVWPMAHRQQPVISSWGHYVAGTTNRLHSVAECICCGFEGAGRKAFEELLPQLSQQELIELLYLAVNLSRRPASSFVYDVWQHCNEELEGQQGSGIPHVSAESVHELLVTAITRCNSQAVNALSYCPAARELVSGTYTFTQGPRYLVTLTPAQLVNNLATLFNYQLRYGLYDQEEAPSSFHRLCEFVCGSRACEAALLSVMLDITTRCASPRHGVGFTRHLATLCDLPLAQHLTGDSVFALLQAAARTGSAGAAQLVAALPGASMLSARHVCDLLAAGAGRLCCIPGHFVALADAQHACRPSSSDEVRLDFTLDGVIMSIVLFVT